MKRILVPTLVLLIGLLGHTTFAQGVTTDFDRNTDFNQYKTFAWVTPDIQVGKNPIYSNPLIPQNIENTLTTELNKRQITMDPANPSLLVGFHIYTEKKVESVPNPPAPMPLYYPFGFRNGWRYMPYGFGNWPYQWNTGFQNIPYTEGTLIVDFVDAHTKQLVWRGTIQGAVNSSSRIEREVTRGIEKIMKDYPVKPV